MTQQEMTDAELDAATKPDAPSAEAATDAAAVETPAETPVVPPVVAPPTPRVMEPLEFWTPRARAKDSPSLKILRLTPYAWAKLRFFRDSGDTEVGGFGLTSEDDLLLVRDFHLPRQRCSYGKVNLDEEAMAELNEDLMTFNEKLAGTKRPLATLPRIWIHTHPGSSAQPSSYDESMYGEFWSEYNWSWGLMFILAKEGETFARIRSNGGPGVEKLIDIAIDYAQPFHRTQERLWEDMYKDRVKPLNEYGSHYSPPYTPPPPVNRGNVGYSQTQQNLTSRNGHSAGGSSAVEDPEAKWWMRPGVKKTPDANLTDKKKDGVGGVGGTGLGGKPGWRTIGTAWGADRNERLAAEALADSAAGVAGDLDKITPAASDALTQQMLDDADFAIRMADEVEATGRKEEFRGADDDAIWAQAQERRAEVELEEQRNWEEHYLATRQEDKYDLSRSRASGP